MRKSRPLLILTCCLLFLVVAACGGSDTGSNGTSTQETANQEVTITVRDNSFDPKEVEVPAHVPVKVTFRNQGKTVHIVEIKGLTSEETLQPGQSKSFTLTASEQSYKMYDELYEGQGMTGVYKGVKQ